METHVVKGTQEILTQDLPQAEELLTQEGPQDAEVLTDEPADKKPHTRNRRARAFTMSDEVHALLGTLAQRNGTNMSTYIENPYSHRRRPVPHPPSPGTPGCHGDKDR